MYRKGSNRIDADKEPARAAGFRLINFMILAAGGLAIVTGYFLLDRGSITAAPVLLVLGYAVLIPVGVAWGLRSPGQKAGEPGRGE